MGQKGWEVCWALMGKGSILTMSSSLGVKPPECQNKGKHEWRPGGWGGDERVREVGVMPQVGCVHATVIGARNGHTTHTVKPFHLPSGCVRTLVRHIHCLPHQMGSKCRGCLMAMVSVC